MAEKYLSIWEPFRDLVSMRADMDRLFNSFFGRFPEDTDGFWSPVLDIEENNGNLIVKAEIPGMKKDDIRVSVHNNVLSITGERKQKKETKNKTEFYRLVTKLIPKEMKIEGEVPHRLSLSPELQKLVDEIYNARRS